MNCFLVTTSIRATWPKNQRKISFLGEWCRLYKYKDNPIDFDFSIFPYHWDDRKKMYRDYKYLDGLYENILIELAVKLNQIHCINENIKYWRILIGPWLFYFINILYDRWEMIQYAIKEGNSSDVILLNQNIYENIPSGMDDFNNKIVTDEWNELVYSEIIRYSKFFNIYLTENPNISIKLKNRFNNNSLKDLIINFLSFLSNKISLFLGSGDSIFIISSSMSKFQELLLQIKLKQIPRYWMHSASKKSIINIKLRSSTCLLGMINNEDSFGEFTRRTLFKFIPSLYLEGYQTLINDGLKTYSNKAPTLIYTTLSYQFDDKFKAWAANQIINNDVPFVVGQHGGNFGMSLWNANEEHQLKISDFFLSWGWKYPHLDKILPVCNFKTVGEKKYLSNRNKALMIGLTTPRFSYHMFSAVVSAGQWEKYFKSQIAFVENLMPEIQKNLSVRLSPADYEYSQGKRWLDFFPFIKLDYGNNRFYKELKNAKIFISTYNSTSYLETMALNIPTLLFWDKNYWECNELANSKLKCLEEAGILFSNPIDAAKKLNSVWNNVDQWWDSNEIQDARMSFCNTFSRVEKNSLNLLSSTLIDISKNHN